MRGIILITVIALTFHGCQHEVNINYDLPLDDAVVQSREMGKPLVVLLSRPDCPPCSGLVRAIEKGKNIPAAFYNVVDTQEPENQWYTQWLCTGASPTSCLFDADGHLKALVSGGDQQAMDCLQQAMDGKTKCAEYHFNVNYPIMGNNIEMLNEVLDCQRAMERGEDVGKALDKVLKKCNYPWPVWLKIQNEIKQGRTENARDLADQLTLVSDPNYLMCYADILQQAKYIANPNYSPDDEAKLVLPEDIELTDCIVEQPREFDIEISNEGKYPLQISDIKLSCTCLELLSDRQLSLAPNEKSTVRVAFTPETTGDFYREVMFFSNSAEKLMRVAIHATAKS